VRQRHIRLLSFWLASAAAQLAILVAAAGASFRLWFVVAGARADVAALLPIVATLAAGRKKPSLHRQ